MIAAEIEDSKESKYGVAHDRWEHFVDIPLIVLALASIPLLVLEANASEEVASFALFANWIIWALFAFDLLVRMWLTDTSRWRYLVSHWFDVVIVGVAVVPIFRPVRILRNARMIRVARSLRVVSLLVRFWHGATRVWRGVQGRLVGVAVLVVLLAGSVGMWTVERHADDANIKTFNDATWWAITTVTTVGYGDMFPVTPEGRGIAAFLMMAGIAVFGVVSANLAAMFLRSEEEPREDELLARIDALSAKVDELLAASPRG